MKLSDYRHMPPVASLMTSFPHFVEPQASIESAQKLMEQHAIDHLPVKQSGAVVGLISAADVASMRGGGAGREARVGDIASDPLCIVEFGAPLTEALRTLADRRVNAAVVLRDGKLAGILTTTDVCRALCDFLEHRFPEHPDGAA